MSEQGQIKTVSIKMDARLNSVCENELNVRKEMIYVMRYDIVVLTFTLPGKPTGHI